jgi:tetratricopeptide (TPR) repeat protein
MESYRLKSKVSVNEREFLVQTVNDVSQGSVVSSLFVNGEILEVSRFPHESDLTEEAMLSLVKRTHDLKKTELEQLLSMHEKTKKLGDSEMMLNLGIAFYYKRILDEARELFDLILELKPDNHEAANYLGLTCMEQGDYEAAVKAFSLTVEMCPSYADYHNNYGEALLEAGFCQRAVEELEAALKLNIYYADAYFNLALAYIVNTLKREDFDMYANLREKSNDLFNRAALISPEYKTIEFDEAREVFNRNDLPRAMNLFRAVRAQKKELSRQKFSGFYLRFLLQSDWVTERTLDERIRLLMDEIDKNPSYVDLHHQLALCYLQRAQLSWHKGIGQFEETIQMNPRLNKAQKGLDIASDFAETMKKVIADIVGGSGDN